MWIVRWFFLAVMAVHGLIHLLGFTKAFGLYVSTELSVPITRLWGGIWLLAAVFMVTSALAAGLRSTFWPYLAFAAMALSQIAIVSAWPDAKFGTIPNVLISAVAVHALFASGPLGLLSEYRGAVESRMPIGAENALLQEEDLEGLPDIVGRFVRRSGAVGQPRPSAFRAKWRGRIRMEPEQPWMDFVAEQYNVPAEPARFFWLKAKRGAMPFEVYHAFSDGAASMRVRLLSMFPVASAQGSEMTRAETVTLLNDLCVLCPAALLAPAIQWRPLGEREAEATFETGGHRVRGILQFGPEGELENFVSEDRLAASSDGKSFKAMRWSTPVGQYKAFGSIRVPSVGEARWHEPEGDFSYLEIELVDLQFS